MLRRLWRRVLEIGVVDEGFVVVGSENVLFKNFDSLVLLIAMDGSVSHVFSVQCVTI